jgi:hypothetical protein
MEHNGKNGCGGLFLKADIPGEIHACVNKNVRVFARRSCPRVGASTRVREMWQNDGQQNHFLGGLEAECSGINHEAIFTTIEKAGPLR